MVPLNWGLSKVFYGWWIVGAAFFIALYVGGTVFYGFTAVFEPIAGDLGWNYTQISLAASLRGLEMGLLAPLSGILIDRWGSLHCCGVNPPKLYYVPCHVLRGLRSTGYRHEWLYNDSADDNCRQLVSEERGDSEWHSSFWLRL
jgi:hypothetical protein